MGLLCVACVEVSAHDVTSVSCRFSLAVRQFWHYARSKKQEYLSIFMSNSRVTVHSETVVPFNEVHSCLDVNVQCVFSMK